MAGYPRTGEQVGPYLVTAELGRGGMGVVYRATQAGLNRPVALKILDPRLAADRNFVQRFSREASILASLDSPHIIQIFDHGDVDGYLTLAMQYVAGGDLSQLIGRTGPLPPAEALEIFRQIVEALGDAHSRGIVHRDVKPGNVLLRADSPEPFAYLCDFGIATTGEPGITETGAVVGSYAFMSPERQSGQPATPQSDFYSAACVLWAMLTSRNVYSGTDMQVAMKHLTLPVPALPGADPLIGELNRIFCTCLAKDPAERPQSASELLNLVKRAHGLAEDLAPLDVSSPDSGIFRPLRPSAIALPAPEPELPAVAGEAATRRGRGWLVGAGAGLLVVVLAATLITWNWQRTAGPASGVQATPISATSTAAAKSFACWNGNLVTDAAGCSTPVGTAALRYLYPSLDKGWDACAYAPYRKTTDSFDCDFGSKGLIRYRYWQDANEASGHYREKYLTDRSTDLLLDGQVVGTRYISAKKTDGRYSQSFHWLDAHFSLTVEADTKAGCDKLLKKVRVRSYADLLGHPVDRQPAEGVVG